MLGNAAAEAEQYQHPAEEFRRQLRGFARTGPQGEPVGQLHHPQTAADSPTIGKPVKHAS